MTKPKVKTMEDYDAEVERAHAAFKASQQRKIGPSIEAGDRYAKALRDRETYKRLTRRT